jgi:multiple sugar transport system permease protein
VELFRDFNFGQYMWTSFYVSVLTVLITLLFSVPGAYAVARLRFRGRAAFSRSILLIYMVPMIVLALPIYIAFSITGLRNTILGIVLIYPVTTIPVALYMLQGYFRGLPAEVEEAGLMDGLNRLQVIWKITLPLVAAGAGQRVALRLHDRVERVSARLHAARRPRRNSR